MITLSSLQYFNFFKIIFTSQKFRLFYIKEDVLMASIHIGPCSQNVCWLYPNKSFQSFFPK